MKKILALFIFQICFLFTGHIIAQVNLTADKTEGCAPLDVQFSIEATGATYYEFYVEDSYYSGLTNSISHTFETGGEMYVYVYAYDSELSYIGSDYLYVDVKGSTNVMNLPQKNCPGTENEFFLDFEVISCLWNFGDGSTSTDASAAHAYSSPGTYDVFVIVETECGLDTISDSITIVDNLSIKGNYSMNISPKIACPGTNVSINIWGWPFEGLISDYSIDFGNGVYTNYSYGSHRFTEEGKYAVKGTFINSCGNDTTLIDTVVITRDLPFKGNIYLEIYEKTGCTAKSFSFYSYSGFKTYTWNFGDGKTATGTSVSHNFDNEGKYPISLTVTDFCGNDSTVTDTVIVSNSLPFSGEVYIISGNKESCPGSSLEFSTEDYYNTYFWDFGNGKTAFGPSVSSRFTEKGTYKIKLTVTDDCGVDTTVFDSIKIIDNISIDESFSYTISNKNLCPFEEINFSLPNVNIKNAEWSFGDGNKSRLTSTNHKYLVSGKYPVSLIAENWCGSDTTVFDTINVLSSKPITEDIEIDISSYSVCPETQVQFYSNYNFNGNRLWNFGDSTYSSSYYDYHKYKEPGKYYVSLKLTNYCGTDTTLYDSVLVKNDIKITDAEIYSPSLACPGQKITFYAEASGLSNAVWYFGDNDSIEGTTAYHSFDITGTYKVSAAMYNGCNMDTTIEKNIVIENDVEVGEPWSVQLSGTIDEDENMYFYLGMPGSDYYTYIWDFGDGEVIENNSYSMNYPYHTTGTYEVKVTVKNSCGTEKEFTGSVKVVKKQYVEFNVYINKKELCPGEQVYFEVYGSFKAITWKTGDGFTTGMQYFSHFYNEPGEYMVQLDLTDMYGNDTTVYSEITVNSGLLIPELDVEISDNFVCPGQSVNLEVNNENFTEAFWNFGDGTNAFGDDVYHSFSPTGIYDVTVTAKNYCGDTLTYFTKVFVEDDIIIGNIEADISRSSVCPNENVGFYVYGNYSSYKWEFGDGISSDLKNVNHSYTTPGEYTVKLTVENHCGISKSISYKIVCSEDVQINYLGFGSPAKVCPNSDIDFSPYYNYPEYLWDFGDGTTSEEIKPSHAYSSTGTYTVSLTATNYCGNSITTEKTVLVTNDIEITEIDLEINPEPACPGSEIQFSIDDYYNYTTSWNFGDGESEEGNYVTHAYENNGTYTVTISAENTCGNSAEFTRNIQVGGEDAMKNSIGLYVNQNVCPGDKAAVFIEDYNSSSLSIDFGDGYTTTETTNLTLFGEIYRIASHAYSSNGLKTIKVNATNGCGTYTDSVRVWVGEGIKIDGYFDWFWDYSEEICVDTNIVFYAEGGNKQVWNFGDGSEEVVTEGGLGTVNHEFANEGSYTVSVTFTNGCGEELVYSDIINISCTTSSIGTITMSENVIKFYPNPADNELRISSENNLSEDSYIEIFNIVGELVVRKDISEKSETLDISSLKPGMYLVRLYSGRELYQNKLIKK